MIPFVVAAYLLFLLLGSFRKPASLNATDDYLLAGRSLTLIPFVATMVTTSYGWILGIGELYYTYGISAWLFLSLPYSLFGLFMAFFFSQKIREKKLHSVPELFNLHYGKWSGKIASLAVLLAVSPAMYALMTAQILQSVFALPVWTCLLIALIFSSVYLYRGGFALLAKKDTWKFLFMFGGFFIALVFLFDTYGIQPLQNLAPEKLSFNFSAHPLEIITWFLLAMLVFADPGYHQRIYSSKSPKTARVGLLISVLCWTFFDFMAASVALYGLGLLPDLDGGNQVYPLLANSILPQGVAALFLLGLLATVMSTLDSFLFLSAQTLVYDLFGRKKEAVKWMPIGLLAVSVLTFVLLLPYLDKSAVDFFFDFTPYLVCVLVMPTIGAFFPFITLKPKQVLFQIGLSLFVCVAWNLEKPEVANWMNAVIPSLSVALVFQLILTIWNKTKTGIQN
ncbi:MAG: hypothetical protein LPK45_01110 [Bacteroidota bacterium]|nr:hypothetical protein [Bacteroidota bacterium]MDX5429627.1 hypothetical protein [Bacteroidota bacterium]MDX5468411.1 hypothetical protein [Bacteroidota bacterium]